VVAQVASQAGEADPAAFHDVGVVGQAERDGGELLDQQHAGAGFGDRGDHRDQPADHDRRQAEGELVDQQVAGLADQRLGQHDHLLLAAGQGPGGGREPQGELGEQLEDPVPAGLGLLAGQRVAGHPQVVGHSQVGQQPAAFGDDRDARLPDPLRPATSQVGAVHEHGAGLGPQDAADGQDQGGLARAVRAEQGGDLAGRDLHRDVLDHGAAAALDGELTQLQRAHWSTPR
jgi:hypothetical protein